MRGLGKGKIPKLSVIVATTSLWVPILVQATIRKSIQEIFSEIKTRAFDHSYDLKIAQATALQKRAQHFSSWAHWLPRVDLQFSQTRSKDFTLINSGALGTFAANFTPQISSLSRYDLNLTMPIYRRSVHLAVEQSSREKKVSEELLRQEASKLDWRLRELLGEYLLKIYKSATIQNSIDLAKNNLKEALLRFELGQKTKVDVLRSQSNLVSFESKKILFEQERLSARSALTEYSGIQEKDFRDIGLGESFQSEEDAISMIDEFTNLDPVLPLLSPILGETGRTELEKQVTANSPVYSAYLAQEELDITRGRTLMAQEYPELNLQGGANRQSRDWNTLFSGDQSYSASVVLIIPLFSGGSLMSSYYEKKEAQKATSLKNERDRLRFLNSVDNERVQIQSLMRSLEAQKLRLAQNEEIVRLSFKSYQLGKATLVELLGSQNDLIESKISVAQAKTDLMVMARRLAWNLGVGIK